MASFAEHSKGCRRRPAGSQLHSLSVSFIRFFFISVSFFSNGEFFQKLQT